MKKYFADWKEYDEQVPLYDFRGYDLKTVESVGAMIFTRVMPRADLVAYRRNEVLLGEFDKQIDVLKVSRLLRYADALRNDYLRPAWRTAKLSTFYVTPGYDARIEDECRRLGVRYIVEPEPVS